MNAMALNLANLRVWRLTWLINMVCGWLGEFLTGGLGHCLLLLCYFLAVERDVVVKVVVDLNAPHTVIWYVNNF